MYERTGLQVRQGLGTRLGAAATAGPTTTPEKTGGFKIHVGSTPSSAGVSSVPVKKEDGAALSPAELPPASMTTAIPAEQSSLATPPRPPSTGPVIPRSPWETRSSGSAGGNTDKFELIAEIERKSGKRVEKEGGAHSGNSREAALKAELERKFGKNPGREPERVVEGRPNQSTPSYWEASSELGIGGGGDGDGDGESKRPLEPQQKKTGKKRRRGRGKGRRKANVGGDGADREGGDSESSRDLTAATGRRTESEDVEVAVGKPASGGEVSSPAPRKRERSRQRGSGGDEAAATAEGSERRNLLGASRSHHQKLGSSWNNIHAKRNLKQLLMGLGNDYGVKEMLKAHHVPEVCCFLVHSLFVDENFVPGINLFSSVP